MVPDTIYEIFHTFDMYADPLHMAPSNFQARYVTEDVPYVLAPLAHRGNLLNVPMPHITTIINLASLINQVDYLRQGCTLEKMGLADLSVEEIITKVTTGVRSR